MKRLLAAGLILFALVAIAWAGGWFFISQRVQIAIDTWIEEEKLRDRFWACSSRATSGFPFSVRFACGGPTFKSQSGPVRSATADALTGEASAFNPFHVNLSVRGPMKLVAPAGSATLDWQSFEGSLTTRDRAPDISLRLNALHVVEAAGEAANWNNFRAGHAAFRFQKSPDRAPEADARLVTMSVNDVAASKLDELFKNQEPFRVNLSAVILNAGAATTGTFAERLDRWADSGGRIQIGNLVAEKGASQLNASGDLTVDEQRRPAGQLSVRLSGVGPLLSQFKLPVAPLAIEGLLRGSGNRAGSSLLENRTLPFELRNGRLYVGPLRTPVAIPPLI